MDRCYPCNLEGLIEACQTRRIYVQSHARETANRDFNLLTEGEIVDFIANGGLERPQFINVKAYENWQSGPPIPQVSAFNFYSGPRKGYIAYFSNHLTLKTVIKSMKADKDGDDRYFPFAALTSTLLKGE